MKNGVLITGVLQEGPAAKGGLRPGDVVVKVGERPVQNTGDLFAAVAALAPDSTAVIGVQRGSQALQVKVQVGERPKATTQGR